jgi:hypothetical protein
MTATRLMCDEPAMTVESFPLERARAFWLHRQGLRRAGSGPIDQLIAASGWLRTLGGVDVYLAARARRPGMKRAELEAAVADGRLKVSMAVRGCIYLVPAVEVPNLLAEALAGWRANASRDLAKVGSTWKVIDKAAGAVLAALGDGAMTTDAIRRALPDGAIKSFGDAGKKVGVSSPLPIALRQLELAGAIERVPEGGRLDTERYQWRVPKQPLPAADADPVVRRARIAETFLRHNGPATVGQLQCWTTWSKRDALAALAPLATDPVAVQGLAGDALILAEDRDALRSADTAASGAVSLLSFEDNYLVAHDGPAVVTDPRHHGLRVEQWGASKPATLGTAGHIAHRTIVVDGLVAGFWEVDPRTGGGTFATFEPAPKKLADTIAAAVDDTARFLLGDVGHARAFSLDTMEEVQSRADAIRSGRALGAPSAARKTAPRRAAAKTAAKKPAKKPAKKRR